MKAWKILIIALCAAAMLADNVPAGAQEDVLIYRNAREALKAGSRDFAFLQFNSLLKFSRTSRYYKEALFATGEYYFFAGNYAQARESFIRYAAEFSDEKGYIFAVVFLLRLERSSPAENTALELKRKVVTFKQLSLLFSDSKEYIYKSPLNYNYKAVYFIDRAEIYIDGELFEKVYF